VGWGGVCVCDVGVVGTIFLCAVCAAAMGGVCELGC